MLNHKYRFWNGNGFKYVHLWEIGKLSLNESNVENLSIPTTLLDVNGKMIYTGDYVSSGQGKVSNYDFIGVVRFGEFEAEKDGIIMSILGFYIDKTGMAGDRASLCQHDGNIKVIGNVFEK